MSQAKCKHCKNKKDKTVMVRCEVDDSIYFCCNGCRSVYLLLENREQQQQNKPQEKLFSKLKINIMKLIDKIKR